MGTGATHRAVGFGAAAAQVRTKIERVFEQFRRRTIPVLRVMFTI